MLKKFSLPGRFSRLIAQANDFVGSFLINDPTTPDLVSNESVPPMGRLRYVVKGMSPSPNNEAEKRALNCYVSMGNCINNIQSRLPNPIHSWASTSDLVVMPSAGVEMNAYYDRRSLRFFYYNYKGKNVYFSDSADIITHELGHAILDAMRPDFWSVQALEIWSFHEAFSDIVAIFNLMTYDKVIEKVLAETGGDLKSSNTASRLAEEIGDLIRKVTNDQNYLPNALRDPAVEVFHYVDPSRLPADTENNRLAAECHSFGRVFSSAWYAAFVRSYERLVSKGTNPVEAFKAARDACFSVILKAIPISPRVTNYYSAVAKCMVSVSKDLGLDYSETFADVFQEWGIIKDESVKSLSATNWTEVVTNLRRGDKVIKTKTGALVSMRKKSTARLSELNIATSMSDGQDIACEMADDVFYEFDSSGRLVDEITQRREDLLKYTSSCVSLSLSDDMWEVKKGNLVRKMIR